MKIISGFFYFPLRIFFCQLTSMLVLLGSCEQSMAQSTDLKFEHLTKEQGLSDIVVWDILQDKQGFMWFATNDGLNKYDGYRFTVYKFTPHDTTSIAHNTISALWEDSEGNFWIGTIEGGICKFDRRTEQFTTYTAPQPKNLYVPALRAVSAINEDEEGMMWIGNWAGELRRFDKRTGIFSVGSFDLEYRTTLRSNNAIDGIHIIFRDRKGKIWIGNKTGLHQVQLTPQGTGKPSAVSFIHYYHHAQNPNSLSDSIIKTIYEDHKGMLWIGTDNGLNRFNPTTGMFTRYFHDPDDPHSLSNNIFYQKSITEDLQGNLWLGTVNGLNKLNPARDTFTRYFHDPTNSHSLNSNQITSLHVDQAGTLWIGTFGAGVDKVDFYQQPFNLYRHHPYNSQSLSHNWVSAIYEDRVGTVWIGTYGGGLNALDKKTGKFTHYRHHPTDPTSLHDDQIKCILEESEGTLWIGNGSRISRFDPETERFINTSGNIELDKSLENINTIHKDRQGILWIGTMSSGMKRFDPKTGELKHYRHDPYDQASLTDHQIFALCEDNNGDLWIGHGSVGTSRMNKKTGKFKRYSHNPLDTASISSNRVISIYQDSKDRLWLGTAGGGLCQFHYDTESFTTYTEKQGLANNSVNSILEDNKGNLWLGTSNGLSRFSPATQTFINYEAGDGLQSGQFYQNACFKGRDGTLYFGGTNGLNVFHPSQLQSNKYVPPVVITQFKLFDKVLPGKHEAKEIEFNYNENFFSIEFAALNYTNSRKNQYLYQLEGIDKAWVKAASNRLATYTDVSPGSYTFRVKGSNNDGVWNEKGATLRIIIHPPFWDTTWAYIGYGLVFVAGLLLARKVIVNRERLQADLRVKQIESEKLRELDSMKSRFFANLSHEFRTPLSIIDNIVQKWSLQDTVSQEQKSDFGMIGRNAARLLQLINQLLDLSRLEAGQLTPHLQAADISAQLRGVAGSFESLAQSKGITYRYALPLNSVWALADTDKVEKIITNLLTNAIKFTPSGRQVVFTASLQEKVSAYSWLTITVQDTGIGISAKHLPYIFDRFYQADQTATRQYEGTGIGLALTKELTELLGGSISVESQPGQGTIFTVKLPLQLTEPPLTLISHEKALLETELNETTSSSPLTTNIESRSRHNEQVLIVEDNPDLRSFIKESLSTEFTILEASDGEAGVKIAVEKIPDLIISDVMMPGMDGFSLCEKLKTDERTSHIPIILLTAKADMASKLTGLTNRADDYLTKPFQLDELHVRIKNLILQRQQLRQRFSRQLTLQPAEVVVASIEEKFLQKAMSIVEDHIGNTDFDVEVFSREMGMSSSQLRRKLVALTDQAPTDFIRQFRLQRAAVLLRSGQGNVSEVALTVGFNSLNYFTRCFREHFGKTPSEFIREPNDLKAGT